MTVASTPLVYAHRHFFIEHRRGGDLGSSDGVEWLLLDTGSPTSFSDRPLTVILADSLAPVALKKGPFRLPEVMAQLLTPPPSSSSPSSVSSSSTSRRVGINSPRAAEVKSTNVIGIIGMDIMGQYQVELDLTDIETAGIEGARILWHPLTATIEEMMMAGATTPSSSSSSAVSSSFELSLFCGLPLIDVLHPRVLLWQEEQQPPGLPPTTAADTTAASPDAADATTTQTTTTVKEDGGASHEDGEEGDGDHGGLLPAPSLRLIVDTGAFNTYVKHNWLQDVGVLSPSASETTTGPFDALEDRDFSPMVGEFFSRQVTHVQLSSSSTASAKSVGSTSSLLLPVRALPPEVEARLLVAGAPFEGVLSHEALLGRRTIFAWTSGRFQQFA